MKYQAHLHNSLKVYTRQAAWIEELTSYLNIQFSPKVDQGTFTHFADEPQIKTWEQYVAEAKNDGAFTTLKKYLVQLHFPIEEGISQSEAYRAVTRKGENTRDFIKASGLILNQPNELDLQLYPSLAGRIPVLKTANRADFVALVRALSCRNEPIPIPESVGAAMIKGLNNWHRLSILRSNWQSKLGNHYRNFQDYLHKYQCLYQDRLIVLSRIPYSNVAAHKLGLNHEDWLDKSVQLRLAHECAHYFTLRYFGQMNSHLHDELIADYLGLKAIIPHFKADWFLHFMGLEDYPKARTDGRFFHYLGKPVLSEGASTILQEIVINAAHNIEVFDKKIDRPDLPFSLINSLLTICHFNLVDIASGKGVSQLLQHYEHLNRNQVFAKSLVQKDRSFKEPLESY